VPAWAQHEVTGIIGHWSPALTRRLLLFS
jgi:hypothetical protein